MPNKIICAVLIAAMLFPSAVSAQIPAAITKAGSQNRNKQPVTLLCHEWNINNNDNTSGQAGCFPADYVSTIYFYRDGHVSFNAKRKTEGAWKYENTMHDLYITVNGGLWKYKILSLTENQLILENITNRKSVRGYLWRTKQ